MRSCQSGEELHLGKSEGDFIVESMIEKTFIVDAPDKKIILFN